MIFFVEKDLLFFFKELNRIKNKQKPDKTFNKKTQIKC